MRSNGKILKSPPHSATIVSSADNCGIQNSDRISGVGHFPDLNLRQPWFIRNSDRISTFGNLVFSKILTGFQPSTIFVSKILTRSSLWQPSFSKIQIVRDFNLRQPSFYRILAPNPRQPSFFQDFDRLRGVQTPTPGNPWQPKILAETVRTSATEWADPAFQTFLQPRSVIGFLIRKILLNMF